MFCGRFKGCQNLYLKPNSLKFQLESYLKVTLHDRFKYLFHSLHDETMQLLSFQNKIQTGSF